MLIDGIKVRRTATIPSSMKMSDAVSYFSPEVLFLAVVDKDKVVGGLRIIDTLHFLKNSASLSVTECSEFIRPVHMVYADKLLHEIRNYNNDSVNNWIIVDESHKVLGYLEVCDLDFIISVKDSCEKDWTDELAEELSGTFDMSFDEIFVADSKGKLLSLGGGQGNRFYGKDNKHFIGKYVYELESERFFYPSITLKVFETKKREILVQDTRKGRRILTVAKPILDREGNIEKVIGISRDITDLAMLQKRLEQSEELLSYYRSEIVKDNMNTNEFIFESPKVKKMMEVVLKIADSDTTVLLKGESGVGKELIGEVIHRASKRRNKRLVKVNCGAIPENLLESELFGYEKGAFTGAGIHGKPGIVEQANEGTLFLDEITELPLNLQVKLLRLLQENEIYHIGGLSPLKVDVRIIAVTNRNIEEMVANKAFREDLYYRLNVVPIVIPPLRDRKEDIIPLVQHFLHIYNSKNSKNILLSK